MLISSQFACSCFLATTGSAAGAAGAADAAVSSAEVTSVWDFVTKGGPMMIPLALCSLVALTVIIERLISLRRKRVIPPSFVVGLRAALDKGAGRIDAALEFCRSNVSPISNVFVAALRRIHYPIEMVEKHIEEAGQREVIKLRKYLRVLAVIAAVSPLVGLLGTIFGMIIAFQTVATSGEALGKTEMLADGIYQAMITTAAGLIVAIPALVCYHWLSAKVQSLVTDIDHITLDFMDELADSQREESESADGPRQFKLSSSAG